MAQFNTIYQTINNTNQKDYWGAHETDTLDDDYLGSGSIIKKAIDKYGRSNFTKRVDSLWRSGDIMYWIEAMIIDDNMVKDRNNYNQTPGGRGGFYHCNTPEVREKVHNTKIKKFKKMTSKERKEVFARDNRAGNNPCATYTNIYNIKDELMFECHGNFKEIINNNNLPSKQLWKSRSNDGEPIYNFVRACDETRVRNKFGDSYVDKYKGWYALIV